MGCFVDCLVASLVGLDELGTALSYFFKYYWSDRVPATTGALCFAMRIIYSSSESVREVTYILASLEEVHTTLQEHAFALLLDFLLVPVVHCWLWMRSEHAFAFPLDFLLVTVVHCWLWIRLRWTHITSPWGVKTRTRPFSLWCGSVLITLSSPFGMKHSGWHWWKILAKLKGRHVGCHLLILWTEFEHIRIYQNLEDIFEDVAASPISMWYKQ